MSKLKIIEMVILAGTALFTAAKSVVKFVEYVFKLRNKNVVVNAA